MKVQEFRSKSTWKTKKTVDVAKWPTVTKCYGVNEFETIN